MTRLNLNPPLQREQNRPEVSLSSDPPGLLAHLAPPPVSNS
jgi:hypothetical protein